MTRVTEKLFMCQVFMCLFWPLRGWKTDLGSQISGLLLAKTFPEMPKVLALIEGGVLGVFQIRGKSQKIGCSQTLLDVSFGFHAQFPMSLAVNVGSLRLRKGHGI